jgi:8-oxo-dGTP diphosphatase
VADAPIVVVAAVIERDGAFLLTMRPDGTHLAGHWEFPGGKCQPRETHTEALRRELFEELDIVAEVGDLVHTVTHTYPERAVSLHFYRCGYAGDPKPMLGQAIRWVPRAELGSLRFPDPDAELVARLASGEGALRLQPPADLSSGGGG